MNQYEITLKRTEPQWVASIRDSQSPDDGGDSLGEELMHYVLDHDLKVAGPITVIHHSYGKARVELEVVVPVDGKASDDNRVQIYELAACEVASVTHHGPPATRFEALQALFEWIGANPYVPDGPVRDLHLRFRSPAGHWDERYVTDQAAGSVTEIQVPVTRKLAAK